MKLTSSQFLMLENSLFRILTSADRAKAIEISKQLETTVINPFYSKKVYIGPRYKKLYGFYFSSDFDVNFFRIKYPEIIIYE